MTFLAVTRRTALATLMATVGSAGLQAAAAPTHKLRALAFDGFAIFDPRAIAAAASAIFPEQGVALASAWTARLFELTWIETSADRYSGFSSLAGAALRQTARAMDIAIDARNQAELVSVFAQLPLWPDAIATLETLKSAGVRLAFLSNLDERDLIANMHRNQLSQLMDSPLSTERVRAFKPSPRAYAMAPDHFGVPREEIGFVAFAGWDALGAKWFGFPTAWINRLRAPQEAVLPHPDLVGVDLSVTLRWVSSRTGLDNIRH